MASSLSTQALGSRLPARRQPAPEIQEQDAEPSVAVLSSVGRFPLISQQFLSSWPFANNAFNAPLLLLSLTDGPLEVLFSVLFSFAFVFVIDMHLEVPGRWAGPFEEEAMWAGRG